MQTPNRLHDRKSFIKYMSAETAIKVLESSSLRWSSPLLFNDPFDVPRELSFGITADELHLAAERTLTRLILSPPSDTSGFDPRLRMILDIVKNGVSEELKSKMVASIRGGGESRAIADAAMDELRNMWRQDLPNFRILCLTESPKHAAMWYHYADRYRGVALELKCIDELDSAWLMAKPVKYPVEKPAVYTADGWAEIVLRPESAFEDMFNVAVYTKSPDWSYEAEWRIVSHKRPVDMGLFTDYKFSPQELGAIYFGPMTSPDDRIKLLNAVQKYPDCEAWDVGIGMSREFEISTAEV